MKLYESEHLVQLNLSYHNKYDYGLYCGQTRKFPNKESKYQMNYIIADQRYSEYEDRLAFGNTVLSNNLQYYHANKVKGLHNWLLCTAFTMDPNDGPYLRNNPMKKIPV